MSSIKNTVVSILLILSLVMVGPTALADSYSKGMTAYKSKKYSQAVQYFTAAIKENPNEPNRVFYLGMAFARQHDYASARQAFERVTQMVPDTHPSAVKARNNISYLTEKQIAKTSNSAKASHVVKTAHSRGSKSNYLTHVIHNGKIVHFDTRKMPLKVYIKSGSGVPGYNNSLPSLVHKAMKTWQSATQGRVRFVVTSTPKNADIVVSWRKNFKDGIIGLSPFQSAGDTIVRSDVTLATHFPNNTPMPLNTIQSTAIHEFGHALGIRGHSPYPQDIMYFSSSAENVAGRLSTRDITTINMLYKIEADVKNTSTVSTAENKKYYELLQLAYKAQKAQNTHQAIKYYQDAIRVDRRQYKAKYNLAVLLVNEGVKEMKGKRGRIAKQHFSDSVNLLQQVLKSPDAPENTRKNLTIAKKNLKLAESQGF